MAIRGTVTISAPASSVWPFIADPVLESAWNPKIVAVDRDRTGPVELAERFGMAFVMSGKESRCEAEVIECHPPNRLLYRYRMANESRPGSVEISYDMSQTPTGTKLIQTIDMSGMRIPILLRALIALLTRFGRPTGMPYLEMLRENVESFED